MDCAVKGMIECFPHFDAVTLRPILEKSLTKDMMCNKAGLQFTTPSLANGSFPCKIDMNEYNKKIISCTDKLLKMWQANRADKGTCR